MSTVFTSLKSSHLASTLCRMLEDDDPEQEIRRVFDHFDVKGRGSINKKEIGEMFKLLGIGLSQSELDDVFELLDLNGDGVIDYKGKATSVLCV